MFSLHTEGAAYLRYVRRFPIVTSEVGAWNADLVGVSDELAVEVEVKESIADLRAEFRNKLAKHFSYAAGFEGDSVPNFFYVLVRRENAAKASAVLAEKAPYAGLLVAPDLNLSKARVGTCVEVLVKPKRLHARTPSPAFKRSATMRMASEICRFRIALEAHDAERRESVAKELEADMALEPRLELSSDQLPGQEATGGEDD